MKMNVSTAKKYNPSYKKKTISTDPYASKGAGADLSVCGGCHAVYTKKRWSFDPAVSVIATKNRQAVTIVCPACLKIRDNFPGGIVTLKGAFVLAHKQEILHLVKNEEEGARGFNPLERVMSVKENGYGSIIISTTNEKLAQRLGRAIKKAFHGEVKYHWSNDNKLARVDWERAA